MLSIFTPGRGIDLNEGWTDRDATCGYSMNRFRP